MPILNIQVVGEPGAEVRRNLAQRLADAAANVLASGPQNTWVSVHWVPENDYAENGGGPLAGVLPVFVSVIKRRLAGDPEMQAEAAALTKAVAAACKRPEENVHIIYEPPGAGRIAFGGRLVVREDP